MLRHEGDALIYAALAIMQATDVWSGIGGRNSETKRRKAQSRNHLPSAKTFAQTWTNSDAK